MKQLFFIVFIFFTNLLCAANFAVMDFIADGVEYSLSIGTYETFVSNFKPDGFTLVSKMNVRKTAEDMGVQLSTATPQQMKPVMDKLGVTHIVFGKVSKMKGEYVVSVRFIKAGTPPDSAIASEEVHFTGSHVGPVKTLAQNLAKKLKGGKGGDSKTPAKSAKIKNGVGVVYGYLKVFPKDLGFFNSVPEDIIDNINAQKQYGYNTWRVPTENELSLLVSEGYIRSTQGYMSDTESSGKLRLVTNKDTAEELAEAEAGEEALLERERRAEYERQQAEQARSEAEYAKQRAEKYKSEAEYARQQAEQARSEAEYARQQAEQARSEAETAKWQAEKAKSEAEYAKWQQVEQEKESAYSESVEQSPRHIDYGTSADEYLEENLTKRFNFGIGIGFDSTFGMGVGLDFDWKVFEKYSGFGAGNMWLGLGFDFQYWIPIELAIPIKLNFGYEFNLDNRILRYVGVWYTMGLGMNFLHPKPWDDDEYYDASFTFAWELYMSMIFRSRFLMDFGFAGFSGADWERSYLFLDIGLIF